MVRDSDEETEETKELSDKIVISGIYGVYTLIFSIIGFFLTLVISDITNLAIVYLIWCICECITVSVMLYGLYREKSIYCKPHLYQMIVGSALHVFYIIIMFANFVVLLFGSTKFQSISMLPQNAVIAFLIIPLLVVKVVFEFKYGYLVVSEVRKHLLEKEERAAQIQRMIRIGEEGAENVASVFVGVASWLDRVFGNPEANV
ncbi:hypothetical protein FO519_009114 [Halicephalobus sp. NKZ332]|nr:hypothetical protein FO519_009114 [Halicephalobus sp. NKZ332]